MSDKSQGSGRRWRSKADIAPDVWVAWLDGLSTVDEATGARRIAGRSLSSAQTRQLHRWRNEGVAPTFFQADTWAVRVAGVHVNEFLDWAGARGCSPWAAPDTPPWFELVDIDDDPRGLREVIAAWPLPPGELDDFELALMAADGTRGLPVAA